MGVGTNLKEILRSKKMTIKQLSELADIPVNTLYSITKRDSERVDKVILNRLAAALGVDPYSLYSFDQATAALEERINARERVDTALGKLNHDGQQKAVERVEELTEIPRYRAETGLESTPAPTGEVDITDLADAPETFSEGK